MATGETLSNRDASQDAGLRSLLCSGLASLITIIALAWAMDLFQALAIYLYPAQIVTVVLGLAIALAFIHLPARRHAAKSNTPWYDWLAAGAGLVTAGWMSARYPQLVDLTIDAPNEVVIIGLTQILLTLEALRRASGPALPLIVIAFITYAVAGHLVPGPFAAQQTSWDVLAGFLAFDANALPGGPLLIVCNIVISFVFFGNLLQVTGGAEFFANLAQTLMGRYRGGPAKVAVLGSALFGSISGSAVANVAATGVITIPMIRKSGYSSERAAAIEAVSSTGGQLLPPVMGAAAFLMADFLRISYAEVVLAALIPGILYYVSLFIQVDLLAGRDGHTGLDAKEASQVREMAGGWFFLLPFVALVVALFVFNIYPQKAAIVASVVLVTGAAIFSYKGSRPNLAQIAAAIRATGLVVFNLVLICAGAGIVIGVLANSGLGFTFTNSLFLLGSGSPMLLLLLAACVCVILGMGLPTLGVYVLLATLVAPGLVEIGIAPIAAHLFVMYFGMMSMITPPVAIAAFTAAGIAGANPMRTALTSVKIGWLAYVIPFVFVFSPGLMMNGSFGLVAIAVTTLIAGIFLISIAMTGYFLRPIGPLRRAIPFLAGCILCVPINSFALPGTVFALAATSGLLFLASEIVMMRRAAGLSGGSDNA
ncbi:MAG: TRAP transporter fused permease subunit [Gammaproteobacteria bacterium]|nr:TRAP transporter fused permease subunit [Gammaproteobacteria bacterium]